jgi:PPOX class probable F420-dependent enzyme
MARSIATNTTVSRDELLEFIRPRHHAIVITTRADGGPQASPVTCGVDEQGRIVIATYPERAKTRNARRDPTRVSVLFLSDDFGGPWVQVDGTAEVLDVPQAVDVMENFGTAPAWVYGTVHGPGSPTASTPTRSTGSRTGSAGSSTGPSTTR